MTSPTIPATIFHLLPIGELHESPHNPRKHFDPAGLAELAESLKTHGVLTPLTVRANGKGYEIAAGHRRYRAAKLAGLTEVPAIVRAMSDAQFLEVLVIENDQREDVHPLEEAAGYQALLSLKPTDGPRYDVARIAERVGRSVKYVYDRIKLLNLTKEAQRLFLDNRFTPGHAILLARLTPQEQQRMLDPDMGREGLWEGQKSLLRDPDGEELDDPYADLKPVSVRELEAHIADHVRFDETRVDPVLFPETLATVQAAKDEKAKIVHITYDSFVQHDARSEQRTYCASSWKRADGKQGSKTCDRSVIGFIVVGYGQGQAFRVCVNKDKCRVHWGAEIKAREKRQRERDSGTPSESVRRSLQDDSAQKREQEMARRKTMAARWEKATPEILTAVAGWVKAAPTKASGVLAQLIVRECQPWGGAKQAAKYMPLGTTADDLIRHVAFMLLHETISNSYHAPEHFPKFAKALGIDVQKILDQKAPIEKPKTAPPAKGQHKGKKGKAA